MEKLKPCPFCGEEKDLPFEQDNIHKHEIRVICNNCGCSSGFSLSKNAAVKTWNTRLGLGEIKNGKDK
jgi:Lar family restriction alleviation protein